MLCVREKRKKKKKEDRKKNKIEFFTFDFLACKKDQCNSGSIFDIKIAKGVHLQELCIILLFSSWSCSHFWGTENHFEPAQSLFKDYYTVFLARKIFSSRFSSIFLYLGANSFQCISAWVLVKLITKYVVLLINFIISVDVLLASTPIGKPLQRV